MKRTFNDTQRMDWLEKQIVEVRSHLQWGSRLLFTEYDDGDEGEPSEIRKRIDLELRRSKRL